MDCCHHSVMCLLLNLQWKFVETLNMVEIFPMTGIIGAAILGPTVISLQKSVFKEQSEQTAWRLCTVC